MRLPNRLFRSVFRMAYPLATVWWRWVGHDGVVIAAWCQDRVLVVQHSYKPHWRLPGGGIKRGELPAVCAARELHEETGIIVAPDDLRLVFTIDSCYGSVHLLEVYLNHDPIPIVDRREILQAAFRPTGDAREPCLQVLEYLRQRRNIALAA